jgi:hypothetical protein
MITRQHIAFDAAVPDRAACFRHEIYIGLFEHERADNAVETWPPAVRQAAAREKGKVLERHPERAIYLEEMSVASSEGGRSCLLVLFSAARPPAACAVKQTPSPAGSPPSRGRTEEVISGTAAVEVCPEGGGPASDARASAAMPPAAAPPPLPAAVS